MHDLRPVIQILQRQAWVTSAEVRNIMGEVDQEVLQMIGALIERGLPLTCHEKKGYGLKSPVSLIDQERLIRLLAAKKLISANRLSVLDETDSTNLRLMSFSDTETLHGRVCVSEYQSSGRGRHGRCWVAAGYQNLMFSLAWRLQESAKDLSRLSLVAGLALCQCLEKIAGNDVKLKWPNDIICSHGKLAGVLVETRKAKFGEVYVVIGVGLNIKQFSGKRFEQSNVRLPIAELSTMLGGLCDRTELLVKLLVSLHGALEEFSSHGFLNSVQKWNNRDAYNGRRVVGAIGEQRVRGMGCGIDDTGAYGISDSQGRIHRIIAGEVRLC